MYSMFIYEAENRSKEVKKLMVIFDANMRPTVCKIFTEKTVSAVGKVGYTLDEIHEPLPTIKVTVRHLEFVQKTIKKRMLGEA